MTSLGGREGEMSFVGPVRWDMRSMRSDATRGIVTGKLGGSDGFLIRGFHRGFRFSYRFLMQFPSMNRFLASFLGQTSVQFPLGYIKGLFGIHSGVARGFVCFLHFFNEKPDSRVGCLRCRLVFLAPSRDLW